MLNDKAQEVFIEYNVFLRIQAKLPHMISIAAS